MKIFDSMDASFTDFKKGVLMIENVFIQFTVWFLVYFDQVEIYVILIAGKMLWHVSECLYVVWVRLAKKKKMINSMLIICEA